MTPAHSLSQQMPTEDLQWAGLPQAPIKTRNADAGPIPGGPPFTMWEAGGSHEPTVSDPCYSQSMLRRRAARHWKRHSLENLLDPVCGA